MPVIIAEIDLIKYGMPLYENKELSDKDLFRSVVLYGRNVASYKFALAESLLQLGKEGKNNKCNDFAAGCSKNRSHPAGQPQT